VKSLSLFVEAPFCAFRPHTSRDYQDTYPFPPPATVFGMLLSLAGIQWVEKHKYAGVKMALALEGEPDQARVFRKLRRVAQNNPKADSLAARRPDYQELLLDVRLWLWLVEEEEKHQNRSLLGLVRMALDPLQRHLISRFGGLALGESTNLVNQVLLNPTEPVTDPLNFLVKDPQGYYSLPIWVDHPRTGKDRASRLRFTIQKMPYTPSPIDDCWITIAPPRDWLP
jgi:CRISPR-associated protein Cas5t